MINRLILSSWILAFAFSANSVFAAGPKYLERLEGVMINLGGGITSGINGSLGYRPFYKDENKILSTLAVRLDFNYLHSLNIPQYAINNIIQKKTNTSLDFSQGENYFHHNSWGVIVDVYPFERVLRLTGGLYNNHSGMSGLIQIGGLVTIGDNVYPFPPGFYVQGDVNFNKNWAPYLGIGMDIEVYDNLYIMTDLGLMLNSYPRVSLSVYGPSAFYVSPEDLKKEEDWIASKVDIVRAIPMLKIGIMYKF